MSEDARWLDGNAIAGLLDEIFGTEVTRSAADCQSCGSVFAGRRARVYRGAGS